MSASQPAQSPWFTHCYDQPAFDIGDKVTLRTDRQAYTVISIIKSNNVYCYYLDDESPYPHSEWALREIRL